MNDQPTEQSKPRVAMHVNETMATDGGFIPALVEENVPGYTPMSGRGEFASPWVWGPTFAEAKRMVDEYNAQLGLTADEANRIVISSMMAPTPPSNPWRADNQGDDVNEPANNGTHDYPVKAVLGAELDDTHVLVGDSGGLSAVYETAASSAMPGLVVVTTEHGPLYLDPDQQYSVLDSERL